MESIEGALETESNL